MMLYKYKYNDLQIFMQHIQKNMIPHPFPDIAH